MARTGDDFSMILEHFVTKAGVHAACPALPCPALPCPALPCPALPCPALPYPALPDVYLSVDA
jgi:hypothetical protein